MARHPQPSGVAPPNLEWLTAEQREGIKDWIRELRLPRVDEDAFVEEVAYAVWLYPSLRIMADRTTASVIRHNLEAAIADGERFLETLNALDANSLQYLQAHTHGRNVRRETAEVLRALMEVRQRVEKFSKRGSRPRPERVQFASLLLHALREHTSAKATSVPADIFDALLCYAFRLVGEKHNDLHNLAAKALKKNLATFEDGVLRSLDSPE